MTDYLIDVGLQNRFQRGSLNTDGCWRNVRNGRKCTRPVDPDSPSGMCRVCRERWREDGT